MECSFILGKYNASKMQNHSWKCLFWGKMKNKQDRKKIYILNLIHLQVKYAELSLYLMEELHPFLGSPV